MHPSTTAPRTAATPRRRAPRWFALASLLLAACPCALATPAPGDAPAPSSGAALAIESFAAARAFSVGGETVTLVATVRNVGSQQSVGGVAMGRMYCLAGLDYSGGDTIPIIPSLAPNAAVSYRWTVRPVGADNALVASFSLMTSGAQPITRVVAIPHFGAEPPQDLTAPGPAPSASASRDAASVGNARVRIRITLASTGMPVAVVWARSGAGWRRVGTVSPLAEALSSEGSQEPWWEFFRVERMRVSNRPGSAGVSLDGAFGLRWRASVLLTLNAGSGAADVQLRMSPTRPMRLAGLRLCVLRAGDRGAGAAVADSVAQEPAGPNLVTAVRWGAVTAGLLRTADPEPAGWSASPIPDAAGADYRLIGWELRAPGPSADAPPGSQFSTRVRLLALSPTQTAADATRIGFTDAPAPAVAAARSPRRVARRAAHAPRRVVRRARASASASHRRRHPVRRRHR